MSAPDPPMLDQLASAALALGRTVEAVITGQSVTVHQVEQARRLAICHRCPEYKPADDRCSVCGCRATWKTRLATEHCPLHPPLW